jgi:hypothetical protein
MNGLVIYRDDQQYEVWCGVDDGDNIINAHIIGTGPTRDEAVAEAVQHLESALEALQSPHGVVQEVDVRSLEARSK